MKLLLLFGTLLGFTVCEESVMSCYYSNWAIYRPYGSLGVVDVEDIADLADVCTHLIYAFSGINEATGEIMISDSTADLCPDDEGGQSWWHCGYKDFTDMKIDHYSLKTLIAVGGMGTDAIFSKVSADDTLRGNFVASVVPFLREHHFDGLDMNWEFPSGEADKANFVMLLSELATVLHGEGLLLTAAVSIGISTINSGYDVPAMSEHLDLIHVMAYDFHGTWSVLTHHNAPLYKYPTDPNDQLTTDFAIHYWLAQGAPAHKLVLGLPMYGRCWTLDDSSQHGVGAPGTVGPEGTYSRTPGMLFYSEICKHQQNHPSEWTIVNDEDMEVPYDYCFTSDSWNNAWCGYDHEESIANKAVYAKSLGLRGMMAWTVDQDDVHKECGTQNFPLTRKAREAFNTPLPTTSPATVTTSPATVTSPSTVTASPGAGLICYSCFDCPLTDSSTQVIQDPDYTTCFTSFVTMELGSFVVRGGEQADRQDGECDQTDSTISCYCVHNLCNANPEV
ncbi:unnamed protein product [Meganyctiphanes norvegica]|uniref:GH18 domain-containing protein n=1 Tax=Meganyctiphanes norvegica TaxID=48144 RepID=A0AAV2PQT3_MEGNR